LNLCLLLVGKRIKTKEKKKTKEKRSSQGLFSQGWSWTHLSGCVSRIFAAVRYN
jgi:hypothetical protein